MQGRLRGGLAVSLMIATLSTPAAADADKVHGCMSPAEAHDILILQKFIAPFRALGEAKGEAPGEAIGLVLCRLGDTFVYDATLLQHDGRVTHVLVNARSGGIVSGRGKP